MVASLEMLSGRSKKEYAKEAQAVAAAPDGGEADAAASIAAANGATNDLEATVAM